MGYIFMGEVGMFWKKDVIDKVSKRLDGWLKDLFGEKVQKLEAEAPLYAIPHSSGIAFVSLRPWEEDEPVLDVRAYVTFDTPHSKELFEFLLRWNDDMLFGTLSLDEEGEIAISYRMPASHLDKNELKHAVLSVLSNCDELDDIIVEKFGGLTVKDKLEGKIPPHVKNPKRIGFRPLER